MNNSQSNCDKLSTGLLAPTSEQNAIAGSVESSVDTPIDALRRRELGIQDIDAFVSSRTWRWPDFTIRLADGSADAYKIGDLTATLAKAPTSFHPYFSMWLTITFTKTSLGWFTIASNVLTISLLNSTGGTLANFGCTDWSNPQAPVSEFNMYCNANSARVNYSLNNLTPDYFDIALLSNYKYSAGTVRKC